MKLKLALPVLIGVLYFSSAGCSADAARGDPDSNARLSVGGAAANGFVDASSTRASPCGDADGGGMLDGSSATDGGNVADGSAPVGDPFDLNFCTGSSMSLAEANARFPSITSQNADLHSAFHIAAHSAKCNQFATPQCEAWDTPANWLTLSKDGFGSWTLFDGGKMFLWRDDDQIYLTLGGTDRATSDMTCGRIGADDQVVCWFRTGTYANIERAHVSDSVNVKLTNHCLQIRMYGTAPMNGGGNFLSEEAVIYSKF